MKGIARVLPVVIAILLLSAVLVSAQDYVMPIDKTVRPGYTYIEFDGIHYRVFAPVQCHLTFTKIDDRYHGLAIRPVKPGPVPYIEVMIEWSVFPTIPLGIDSSSGNDFELDTESGYAEKVS